MKKKATTPRLVVDNDKTLLFEVASEFEVLENQIMREKITHDPDTPRMTKLRELQSTTLKRVLGKLVQTPGKPRPRSRAKLKLIHKQTDD
ncbi:MAG: hypothetical protein ABFS46_12955 [Myxococcota bacterium]